MFCNINILEFTKINIGKVRGILTFNNRKQKHLLGLVSTTQIHQYLCGQFNVETYLDNYSLTIL